MPVSPNVTLAEALAEVERQMISGGLAKHGGNISRAARDWGLTRRGLYLKLERHSLTASALTLHPDSHRLGCATRRAGKPVTRGVLYVRNDVLQDSY